MSAVRTQRTTEKLAGKQQAAGEPPSAARNECITDEVQKQTSEGTFFAARFASSRVCSNCACSKRQLKFGDKIEQECS
jgi:hypothetical protein